MNLPYVEIKADKKKPVRLHIRGEDCSRLLDLGLPASLEKATQKAHDHYYATEEVAHEIIKLTVSQAEKLVDILSTTPDRPDSLFQALNGGLRAAQ